MNSLFDLKEYHEVWLFDNPLFCVKKKIAGEFEKILYDISVLARLNGYRVEFSNDFIMTLNIQKSEVYLKLKFHTTTREILDAIILVVSHPNMCSHFKQLDGVKEVGSGLYKDTCHKGKINLLQALKKTILEND